MLETHIRSFNESIKGLRDFVNVVEPLLIEKYQDSEKSFTSILALANINKKISEDKLGDSEKEEIIDLRNKHENQIKNLVQKPNFSIEYIATEEGEQKSEDSKPIAIRINGATKEFASIVKDINNQQRHIDLLYVNSLISLVSSVESFFSKVLHYYYDKHPDAAGLKDKTLTLADLKKFGSVTDAENHLIDRKIEEILRGSYESWLDLLTKEIKLDLSFPHVKEVNDDLIELYQRRNLFVHNGGIVNSIYIRNIANLQLTPPEIGSQLEVGRQYLNDAINKIHMVFIIIAAQLWKKLDKTSEERGKLLADIIFENLLESRWEFCEGITLFAAKDEGTNPANRTVAQLNNWLCKKRMGKFESIREEVNKADYSDKKNYFQLGLLALREDVKKFIPILHKTLETNEIDTNSVDEFPIFEEIRATDEFKKWKSECKFYAQNEEN